MRRVPGPVGVLNKIPAGAPGGRDLLSTPTGPGTLGLCAWAPSDVLRVTNYAGGFRGETKELGWATCGSWTETDRRTTTGGARATRGVRDVVAGACDRACRRGDAVVAESC